LEQDITQEGLRVLVVEDEALIAMLLEDMIMELGAEMIGPFASLATALTAAGQEGFDVALIDMNLNGERADTVAALLCNRGIPFALASGEPGSAGNLGQVAVLQKPFSFDEIAETLRHLAEARV
jgi:CheY-like chemotaxis protein